jgi:hypothetical protein
MSKITEFCIAECGRQNDLTTEAVAGMVEAWYCASGSHFWICPDNILVLGETVKPQNKNFRKTPVTFQNGQKGIHHNDIERCLDNLCKAIHRDYEDENISADEFYKEFESIHPFEDGNGRVGAILWNVLKGNIYNPVCPPDFFKE